MAAHVTPAPRLELVESEQAAPMDSPGPGATVWSEEAEQAVLGAMLMAPAAVSEVRGRLEGHEFHADKHRVLYRAICAVADRGFAVDPVTVHNELNGRLEQIGGAEYLATLIDVVPTAANAGFHAAIVQEKALRRRLREAGLLLADPALTAERRDETIRAIQDVDRALRAPAGATPSPVRSLREVLEDPAAQLRPVAVLPRLAWTGRVSLFAGREKDGKSTFASAAVAALSRGRSFLGQDTVTDRVLWIGLEEHVADTAARFQAFGANPDTVFLLTVLPTDLSEIHAAIRQHDPGVVVIDSLAALVERLVDDPTQSTEWTPIMTQLARIARETDVALALIHHARKSDGRYRDSSAIGAGVDVILEAEQRPGEDATVRHIRARGRWAMEDFAVRLVDQHFELVTGALSVDTRILVYIEGHPGCSTNAIRGHVGGRSAAVDDVLGRLVREGLVMDQGNGRAHQWYVAVSEALRAS